MVNRIEIDALTGEEIITELTAEEISQLENDYLEKQEAILAEEQAKEAARTSALAKLAALGLTEEEIAAL